MIEITDDKIEIEIGKVFIDATDFRIDTDSETPLIQNAPEKVSYSFKITDKQITSFKKYILKKYGDNLQRCMDCEYCTIILDDSGLFKDLECNLGAGKQEMISNSGCLLIYGG